MHYSPRSYSSTATSYDYLNVVITYECDADVLTAGTDIGIWTYVLGAAADTKQHQPSQSVSGCAYTMSCEKWDDDANLWNPQSGTTAPFNACDTSTGIEIEVDSAPSSGPDYDIINNNDYSPEVTFKYRVIFTSTYSRVTDGTNQVIDEFWINFQNACATNTVTTGIDDYTYEVMTGAAKWTQTPTFSADCNYAI